MVTAVSRSNASGQKPEVSSKTANCVQMGNAHVLIKDIDEIDQGVGCRLHSLNRRDLAGRKFIDAGDLEQQGTPEGPYAASLNGLNVLNNLTWNLRAEHGVAR